MVLEEADAEQVELVSLAAGNSEQQLLDGSLWGPAPTQAELVAGSVANLRQQFARRQRVLAASLSRAEAAVLIGVSEQAITGALDSGRLLGLKHGRYWALPAWQFDAESVQGMHPRLGELAEAFPGGLVSLSLWIQRPSADLDGASPQQALAAGDASRVIDLARALTSAGW